MQAYDRKYHYKIQNLPIIKRKSQALENYALLLLASWHGEKYQTMLSSRTRVSLCQTEANQSKYVLAVKLC
jgi:hypothetical protein